MSSVRLTPTSIHLDGEDISAKVSGYNLSCRARDVPTLVLELNHRATGDATFEGIANIRIATDAPTPAEFLAGIDSTVLAAEVEKHGWEEDPIGVALDILRDLAAKCEPHG